MKIFTDPNFEDFSSDATFDKPIEVTDDALRKRNMALDVFIDRDKLRLESLMRGLTTLAHEYAMGTWDPVRLPDGSFCTWLADRSSEFVGDEVRYPGLRLHDFRD